MSDDLKKLCRQVISASLTRSSNVSITEACAADVFCANAADELAKACLVMLESLEEVDVDLSSQVNCQACEYNDKVIRPMITTTLTMINAIARGEDA